MMLAAGVMTGCGAITRVASFGPLPTGTNLVTLVVTEDLEVVKQECVGVRAHGQLMGCQTSSQITTTNGVVARTVKIVRYAEMAPSPLTFEIEAHELCHAIAALQPLRDPCHDGNHGMLQTPMSTGFARIR